MRPLLVVLGVLWTLAVPAYAADALSEARRLYNLGQYDAAERSAREATRNPATANAAGVVLGRVQLERYRRSANSADLTDAIAALRAVDPRVLEPRERTELTIGLAEALFLEDRFGAAASMFESVLDLSTSLGTAAHERVLDWWATAVDRVAQTHLAAERDKAYERVSARMATEIARDAGSVPAGYWLAAAARGSGDLDRAMNEATAGWVRATLARDRGAALRADLDRLVVQAILPERAARLALREHASALAGMIAEWDAFKARWGS